VTPASTPTTTASTIALAAHERRRNRASPIQREP
jgi:hypothetical protein